MHKMGSNFGRQMLEEGPLLKKIGCMTARKPAQHPGHQGRWLHIPGERKVVNGFTPRLVIKGKHTQ